MNKIVFLIHKTSEETYQACIDSIKSLKRNPYYETIIAIWQDSVDGYTTSDSYLSTYQEYGEDITIIIEDTVLFANENMLNDVIDIFLLDNQIGLIGVKGARYMPVSGSIDDSGQIYGGLFEMDHQRNVFEKKYKPVLGKYVQVEAVSSTMLAVRGYIPIWSNIGPGLIGPILSVSASLYGYKIVVPKTVLSWCFATAIGEKFTDKELQLIRNKFRFKNQLTTTNHCLLTIGIPTYNRVRYFRKCIANIFQQIGNMPWVEVFVSNNDSPDETEKVAKSYFKYNNFCYYRQPVNIKDRNFSFLYENAHGDFVIACGDDDYYNGELILNLLEAICMYPDASVIEIDWPDRRVISEIKYGSGLDAFLLDCTKLYTCISCVVLNHKHYMDIKIKDRFADTHLNQCYVQLEMIRNNSSYVLLAGNYFLIGSGEAVSGRKFSIEDRTPYCMVFVEEYYRVVNYFLDKGLSKDAYEKEKWITLQRNLSWLYHIKEADDSVGWRLDDNLSDIMESYYSYEPYYDVVKNHVRILTE